MAFSSSIHAVNNANLSTLQLINVANTELEQLFRKDLAAVSNFDKEVLRIGQMVITAASNNDDLALALILHNQDVASYPVRHCVDTAIVAMLVARRLKKSPSVISSIVAASLTMNVGMFKQQYDFQAKVGPLTDVDREIIRNHPEEGVRILKQAGVTDTEWLTCVLQHHENEDGSGYPFGKKNMEISQNAKIISIADRYCARVSAREYRRSQQADIAVRDLLAEDKKSINAILGACFTKELGVYPVGSFVKLKNGEVGMVTRRGDSAATPNVHVLKGTSGQTLANPILRDTSSPEFALDHVLSDGQDQIKFNLQQLWGAAARL